jgi:hypothetical protein
VDAKELIGGPADKGANIAVFDGDTPAAALDER